MEWELQSRAKHEKCGGTGKDRGTTNDMIACYGHKGDELGKKQSEIHKARLDTIMQTTQSYFYHSLLPTVVIHEYKLALV